MQLRIDAFVAAVVRFENGEVESLDDGDFGIYYPFEYVVDTWQAYRKYGVLPRAGGYNDQDDLLMRDWQTISHRYQIKLQNNNSGGLFSPSARSESLRDF